MTTCQLDQTVVVDHASVASLSPEALCRRDGFTTLAAVTYDGVDTRCSTPHLVLADQVSSPATVWSDGDRERPPTDGLVHGAVAAVCAALFVDPRRQTANNERGVETVRQTLTALSDGGLLSGHVLVCAVSLVLRAAEANPRTVSTLTIRRVLVAAATLANKAEADEVFSFSHFVSATGVSADLLKGTESQLFERLNFDVSTSAPQFHRVLATIATHLPDAEAVEIL